MNRYLDAASSLDLIHLGQSAGVVYWKPAGFKLYDALRAFIRKEHEALSYQEVRTPSIVAVAEFEASGHLDMYQKNMFFSQNKEYALRPMSCPNHIELYKAQRRSYRELPCALFEFGEVFRNEASGSLQVLFRQRQFCQDDSHVFVRESGIAEHVVKYLKMAQRVYQQLGFESVEYAISLRPENRFGSDDQWSAAEDSLREACKVLGVAWKEQEGDGAFYGPKIELGVRDKLGRLWQMGTLQLDYVLPRRFDLSYQNEQGGYDIPVLLHHAVLGSLERMVGILLEVHGVNLPAFLHPYPKVVVAVSEKSEAYAKALCDQIGGQMDWSSNPLGAKIRHWRSKGVPSLLVVGEQEALAFDQDGVFRANDSAGGKPVPVVFG